MLVDFGRAVDLAQHAGDNGEAHRVMLLGESAKDEMRCVAMRNQMAWSFDADTFGVLASAHVLLHGTHMKIVQGRNNKWRPTTTLKRYWQKDLWNEIFDNLLNFDEVTGTAVGSRAVNLRILSSKLDAYLKTETKSLHSLLSRQVHMLPDGREKL
jgi:checkpoint serine/threonine-protein kinase